MSLRSPCLRRALYGAANWIGNGALVAAFVVATVVGLTGCTVNVIVAPNATLGVDSDLSQNAVQELVYEH